MLSKAKISTMVNEKKTLEIIFERFSCLFITFATPIFFIYQMTVIRPKLLEIFNVGFTRHCFHVLLSTYCFINVLGNLLLSIFTDSRLKACNGEGRYCEQCKKIRPADSWHCATCNACILGRDHHCFFLSCCIGRYNLRYFICFLSHIVTSIAYSTYYDYFVLVSEFEFASFLEVTLSAVRILLPIYPLINPLEMMKNLYALFWYSNVFILAFCFGLLCYHMSNALKGIISFENKIGKVPLNSHWKANMIYVFGTRWYLALLWPFVCSPLPDKRRM
ncbi:probable palmitoyltransferase ZDHHC24 [Cydia splendana]|uniref:probable palmitoyltransferase ZDHHC24 n=1 Tax=Cydia splendana TaxID=1100963 RepID=UPI00300D0827